MFTGLIVGAIAFVVVGVFHPLVIAVEYHLGKRMWPAFVLLAIGAFASSLFAPPLGSMVLGSVGAGLCWSILELVWQHERARKGHAKRNPTRPAEYYDGGKS